MQRIEETRNAVLIGEIHKYRRNIAAAVGEKRVGGSCLFSDRLKYPRSCAWRSLPNSGNRADLRADTFEQTPGFRDPDETGSMQSSWSLKFPG